MATAQRTIAEAIEQAHNAGYQEALAMVERELYSCENLADFLAWVKNSLAHSEQP
jgi:hypothetical protein